MSSLHVWKNARNYPRRHIIDVYRWKCAHRCHFPFCAALCSSSISHITLTPMSPQSSLRSFITMSVKRWLGSLECHGNVVPVCVYLFMYACVFACLRACLFSIFGGPGFSFSVFFFFFFSLSFQKAPEIWRCVVAVTERGETERVDGEERGEVRRSSAAATGRGQRGWQCLLVASLSTWLSLNPAWGQRRVTQHARRLLRGVK